MLWEHRGGDTKGLGESGVFPEKVAFKLEMEKEGGERSFQSTIRQVLR